MANYQNGVRIVKLMLFPVKNRYRDVFRRSFEMDLSSSNYNTAKELFHRQEVTAGRLISSEAISKYLPNLIVYNNMPIGKSEIIHGWNTDRFRFFMHVDVISNGIITSSYVQGYTEYYDVSMFGNIDPRMRFYINSITDIIRTETGRDAHGNPIYSSNIENTYNVLKDGTIESEYTPVEHQQLYLIRPQDIQSLASLEEFNDGYTQISSFNSELNGESKISKRSNNSKINYLRTAINSYVNSKNVSALSSTPSDIMFNATIMSEDDIHNPMKFLDIIKSQTGMYRSNEFTLVDLNNLDPNIKNIVKIYARQEMDVYKSVQNAFDTQDTEDMLQPNIETIKAHEAINSINSLMLDNFISQLSITISNMGDEPMIKITNANSLFDGVNDSNIILRNIQRLESLVMYNLLPILTDNGRLRLTIHIESDVTNDTTVLISVEGGPQIPYRLPTFADSLYSPMISTKINQQSLINDYLDLKELTNDTVY